MSNRWSPDLRINWKRILIDHLDLELPAEHKVKSRYWRQRISTGGRQDICITRVARSNVETRESWRMWHTVRYARVDWTTCSVRAGHVYKYLIKITRLSVVSGDSLPYRNTWNPLNNMRKESSQKGQTRTRAWSCKIIQRKKRSATRRPIVYSAHRAQCSAINFKNDGGQIA